MMAHRSSRGLFIDLDGTLAASLDVLSQVYGRFLDKFGHVATDSEFERLNGLTLSEIVCDLQKKYSLAETEPELLDFYNHLINEAYEQVEPEPGGVELLVQANLLKWTVVIVTANEKARTRRWLERWGMLPNIALIISDEPVLRGKPSPDLYLAGLKRSGCSFQESFAVEDSPKGVQAARSAGLRTIHYCPEVAENGGVLEEDVVRHLLDLIVYLK